MTLDWITAGIGLAFAALLIAATVLMMRHRVKLRAAAREHEHLNVTSNDTRRGFWFSATDFPTPPDGSSFSGGGDGGGD
jgi:hypothetical protein